MKMEGGCYCGSVRFEINGDPLFRGQCHCRECQYISGGSPNVTMGVAEDSFKYTQGTAKAFKRTDLESPVTREFCSECGTHILTRTPGMPGAVLLKVGTFDDPSVFEKPDMAIYLVDKQPFHLVADGVPTFERVPG